ncbi:MAG: rRNA maturation RNase YbeY, partial [Bacilli bacterium]
NEAIQDINRQYRHLDAVTDVISFEEHDPGYLGEIFISIDRLIGQAKEFHHGNERECAFLICHGILHLLGYDHQTPEEEVIMFALQEDILERCGYRRQNNG